MKSDLLLLINYFVFFNFHRIIFSMNPTSVISGRICGDT